MSCPIDINDQAIRHLRINTAILEVSALYRPIMQKAYAGTASPRSVIKAKGLQSVGHIRDDVTHCIGFACPLWAYSPYQIKGGKQ